MSRRDNQVAALTSPPMAKLTMVLQTLRHWASGTLRIVASK
jgi:hypothetical protein